MFRITFIVMSLLLFFSYFISNMIEIRDLPIENIVMFYSLNLSIFIFWIGSLLKIVD